MRPGITLATIMKNEARCLERCLRSVKGVVNDIALVDTGSTDGSQKIAERHGANVIQIDWPNAFDEARNVGLAEVETEWTLWLDADEWLVDGAGQALWRAIENQSAFGFTLVRRDQLPDGRYAEQSLFRLWRTHPDVRFVGVIHESFPDRVLQAAYPGQKLYQSDIAFWHDGFREEVSREKLARNLPLLRRELELRPGQIYYEIELGNTLHRLGDPEGKAVLESLAERLIQMQDQDEPPCNTVDLFLTTFLAGVPDSELHSARADGLLRLARGWFPQSPTALSIAAQVEIRRGNLRNALDILLAVERLAESGRYDRRTSVHPKLVQEALYTNLALVAHQLGRADIARRNYDRLLDLDPSNALAKQNLALL